MISILWSPQANDDFDSIYIYLANVSLIYAEDFYENIENSIQKLINYPKIGRIVPEFEDPLIREILFKKYRMIYGILDTNKIEILTIIHGSQDLNKKLNSI